LCGAVAGLADAEDLPGVEERDLSLEEYPVPVNAEIDSLDVDFIDKPDLTFHPVGVKGLGEVSMVGVAAAVANAVFHATGVRHRRLPITIEDVLAGS
jgi:xanthine dehydrogenase YagR molybdenum-binding subunit